MKIKVTYFAQLKEERKKDHEILETDCRTVRDFFGEIFPNRGCNFLRVAINGEYKSWDTRLANEDEVVFIPPVAGG